MAWFNKSKSVENEDISILYNNKFKIDDEIIVNEDITVGSSSGGTNWAGDWAATIFSSPKQKGIAVSIIEKGTHWRVKDTSKEMVKIVNHIGLPLCFWVSCEDISLKEKEK